MRKDIFDRDSYQVIHSVKEKKPVKKKKKNEYFCMQSMVGIINY